MANIFVVLVVFAAMAQASLAAVDIQGAAKVTLNSWQNAARAFYDGIENGRTDSDINAAKVKYRDLWVAGGKAFIAVTPNFDGKKPAVSEENSIAHDVAETLFGALRSVRFLKNNDCTSVEAGLNKTFNNIPLAAAATIYFALAGSDDHTKQVTAIGLLTDVYNAYFAVLQGLLASEFGRPSPKFDFAGSKNAAVAAIKPFVDYIYAVVPKPKQG